MGVQILGTIHFSLQEQNIKGFFKLKCKLFKSDMTSTITVFIQSLGFIIMNQF